MRPTSRSFHTQRNWKIANDAIAGTDSGSTILRKIRKWLAPSTRAASNRSRGSWAMKLCSRKIASGSANIVCAIHSGMKLVPPVGHTQSPSTGTPWTSALRGGSPTSPG